MEIITSFIIFIMILPFALLFVSYLHSDELKEFYGMKPDSATERPMAATPPAMIPVSEKSLDVLLDDMAILYERMGHIFNEYYELFGPNRDKEIKKLELNYLLDLVPEDKKESILVELYALEGIDYHEWKRKDDELKAQRAQEEADRVLRQIQVDAEQEQLAKTFRKMRAESQKNKIYGKSRRWEIDREAENSTGIYNELKRAYQQMG
jgi:hypothetical protein